MSQRVNHIRGTTTEVESVTPQTAELGYDTTRKEPHIGDGATPGGLRLAKKNMRDILVPAQIVANTNDYNPAGMKHAGVLVVSTDAARDITGLSPSTVTEATDGREITLYNGGAFNATLKDQNASSAAANRFDLGGTDLVMTPKTSVTLRYRVSVTRWELVAQTVGAAVAAGAVIARTLTGSALGFSLINGVLSESRAGGAVTIAIKTLAGADPSVSDPVLAVVRGSAIGTGDYVVRQITAATSLVISSGSSMGATNGAAFRIWVVGFDDAGTFRLAAINCLLGSSSVPMIAPDALASSTAEGGAGAADNAMTFYSGVAVTSKPYAPLGYLDYPAGLASVGNWNAAPTTIQLYNPAIVLPGRDIVTASKIAGSAMGARVGMLNGRIVESRAANAATFALKTLAGADPTVADPVLFTFQDGSGGFVQRSVTAALSLVIPSGQAVGATSGVAFRLWITAIDTGTGVVFGLVNCLSGSNVMPLHEGVTYTSVAIAAAPNAQVIYSASVQAAKYICLVGYIDYDAGLVSAGAWASAPSRMVLHGPGVPRPGETVQQVVNATGALSAGTTTIPWDDTIPQSNEGDQYMATSITPVSAQDVLEVDAAGALMAATNFGVSSALFRDAGASAIAACIDGYSGAATFPHNSRLKASVLAGSVTTTQFKLRAGPDGAATVTFNGSSSARKFGGVSNSFLNVREIMG